MSKRPACSRSLALAVALALLLAGCGVAPPRPEAGETAPLADWRPPEAPGAWRLSGRAAVRTSSDSGTVTVRWRESAGGYRVDLSAPMAAGAVRIEGDDQSALLRTASGDRYRGASPRELLRRAAGYDLPVEYLRWWLRGLPVPDVEGTVTLDGEGSAVAFEQAGWRVTLSEYRAVGDYRLPHRLSVNGEQGSARIAIARWTALE